MFTQSILVKNYIITLKDVIVAAFQDKSLRFHFVLALLALSSGIIANISIPFLLKKSVESFSDSNTQSLSGILVSYGVIWLISQLSFHGRALLTFKIEQRLVFTLGVKVLSHLYGLSQRYFLDQKPGALINIIRRAQRDVPSIILGVFFHGLPTLIEFILVIVLISNLYPYNYSFILVGTLIAFFVYTSLSLKKVFAERQVANSIDQNVDGILTDWLSNHESTKIFGKGALAIDICKTELKKRENSEVKFFTQLSLTHFGQSLILGTGLTVLTYLVGQEVLRGTLTVGDFILFNGYILQFINPISILGQVTQDVKRALIDMKAILEILLTKSEIQESTHSVHLSGDLFQIEFNNVSFAYQDREILKNVSFKIGAGETILIVGPTGTGKSTVAKLLLRLYDTIEGQIFINNTNIKNISFQSLYSIIGWVPQECYLLNDTIQNNIQFVCPEATKNELMEALEKACLLEFINRLPKGLETVVGDKGLKLSSGEKQRISLARLFLKKPKICIFDEATSFLDEGTDRMIQHNIETFLPIMTKIIITHRPFLVNKSHKILTLRVQKISETISATSFSTSIYQTNRN